jgi:DNA-binding NtrC family response regulator
VEVAAAGHTKFIAFSKNATEIIKSANLLKSLQINVLIYGQEGVGKTTLARYIDPLATVIDAQDLEQQLPSIQSNSTIIINNFSKLTTLSEFESFLSDKKIRLIATAPAMPRAELYDKFFSISLQLLELSQREEDIKPLARYFLQEYRQNFSDYDTQIDLDSMAFDISRNCHSLKMSVYKKCFYDKMSEAEIIEVMQTLLYEKIGGKNDYRDLIYLFDLPLFQAGLAKYGSQLKISEKFGLNRNTIRKKIQDLGDRL